MKVVACEKCGAKYQIDDNESVNDYECSVCAGNLIEVEEYPSTYSAINQNHSNNLYQNQDNPNSQIVYCESCGLKYSIDKNEYPEDYECSSCFGNLRYIDEELNENLEKRLKLRQRNIDSNSKINSNSDYLKPINQQNIPDSKWNDIENKNSINNNDNNNINNSNTINSNSNNNFNNSSNNKNSNYSNSESNSNSKSNFKSDVNYNSSSKFESPIVSPINDGSTEEIDKKLRTQMNNKFFNNVTQEYKDIVDSNFNDIEKREEKNSKISIFDRIAKNREMNENEGKKEEISESITNDREIDNLDSFPNTTDEKIDEIINKNNKKQELVPHPNIKNTSYHDVYIVAGLILVLIGFGDILLSQRVYSIIFIIIGFILFGIGVMQNKKYSATEKRGRIIRKKLLTLPENFYVLYFVKSPNANDGINHVVVGASGIFAIVSQSYNEKEDKEKPKIDTENLNLINKSKLDNFDLLGISDIVDQANNNYESNKKIVEENIPVENKQTKVGKFKFRETPLKFENNNKIKQKSIQLSEELIDFLNENGLKNCYVEPLVGFVNNDVAIINMPLTDEDLFLDELIYKIIHGNRQLDDVTTHKVAVLLSQYSTECSS